METEIFANQLFQAKTGEKNRNAAHQTRTKNNKLKSNQPVEIISAVPLNKDSGENRKANSQQQKIERSQTCGGD